MNIVEKAAEFAKVAHELQVRKYSGAPYFEHCERVAKMVQGVGGNEFMIAAAYMHDCAEDVPLLDLCMAGEQTIRPALTAFYFLPDKRQYRLSLIGSYFSSAVEKLVEQVTDVSKPEDGNRATRKKLDLDHLAIASRNAMTIKLADLIDNAQDIQEWDLDFCKIYMAEKRELLKVLQDGDQTLLTQAQGIIDRYYQGVENANL